MALDNAQLATVKAAVLADATAAAYRAAGDAYSLHLWLNAVASPVVKAWMVNVSADAVDEACAWTVFDGIVPGKRDSWAFFLQRPRNFARSKVRKWVTDVWGSATAGSAAEAILQAGLQNASNTEVALGGSTKTTGTVSGLDRAWIGSCEIADANWLINN